MTLFNAIISIRPLLYIITQNSNVLDILSKIAFVQTNTVKVCPLSFLIFSMYFSFNHLHIQFCRRFKTISFALKWWMIFIRSKPEAKFSVLFGFSFDMRVLFYFMHMVLYEQLNPRTICLWFYVFATCEMNAVFTSYVVLREGFVCEGVFMLTVINLLTTHIPNVLWFLVTFMFVVSTYTNYQERKKQYKSNLEILAKIYKIQIVCRHSFTVEFQFGRLYILNGSNKFFFSVSSYLNLNFQAKLAINEQECIYFLNIMRKWVELAFICVWINSYTNAIVTLVTLSAQR